METTTKPGQLHRDLQERGYSNLTAAIKDKQCINWEQLDGLTVWCANPTVGALRGTLRRYALRLALAHTPHGWYDESMDRIYTSALIDAWHGERGWTLYIEGEVPLHHKTADQLDYYTYFYGHTPGEKPVMAYVGGRKEPWSGKRVHYAPCMTTSLTRASNWVVLEEYGTSPKPEDK